MKKLIACLLLASPFVQAQTVEPPDLYYIQWTVGNLEDYCNQANGYWTPEAAGCVLPLLEFYGEMAENKMYQAEQAWYACGGQTCTGEYGVWLEWQNAYWWLFNRWLFWSGI